MEEEGQQEAKSPRHGPEKSEAVRSRWTPKPEQILILESIFNSGMVNPPKDETVRIRKLLEKFGTVGDANVFYWFQNRRSRSRRRQRQMMQQAAAAATTADRPQPQPQPHPQPQPQPQPQTQTQTQLLVGGAIPHDHTQVNLVATETATSTMGFGSSPSYDLLGSSSSCGTGVFAGHHAMDGFFSVSSPQLGFPEIIDHSSPASSLFYPSHDPNLSYHTGVGYGGTNISGFITVFINGIATELPKGPIDIKTLFGEDVMLVHSSGVPIPTNEFGFLMHNLHHGESYFLVSKPTQIWFRATKSNIFVRRDVKRYCDELDLFGLDMKIPWFIEQKRGRMTIVNDHTHSKKFTKFISFHANSNQYSTHVVESDEAYAAGYVAFHLQNN
ncbi:WUSCHEL-related homeobox 11, partial [Mucuna pruriens]